MNIAIGKLGQKLIFNRESKEGIRSATNGNASVWSFYNLLITQRKHDNFIFVGNYDILPSKNCYDINDFDQTKIDIGLFFVGIFHDEKMINFINKSNLKYVLICDDLRCLDVLNDNKKLINLPIKIISQIEQEYTFHNQVYKLIYLPIETSMCYKFKYKKIKKIDNMNILANYSEVYDRLKIVTYFINDLSNINVYGRLDKNTKYLSNFKGEIGLNEAFKKLQQSKLTFLVPVKKDVITTKYVEALMNNCLPIFYVDYGTKYIDNPIVNILTISTKEEFNKLYYLLIHYEEVRSLLLKTLQKKLINPWISGKKLTRIIIKVLKEYKGEVL